MGTDPFAEMDFDGPLPSRKATGSYHLVDLAAIFAAGLEVTPPTILHRTDMENLFYRSAVNSVIGESESGKTWLTLLAAYQQIRAKEKVLFIDFEDRPENVLRRLVDMELKQDELEKYFSYILPEGQFGDDQRTEFEAFGIAEYSLVVMDGVTEAMSLHGLDGRQENDIATFYERLPKWIASRGPAVVLIDHVPKSKDNRGGYAIGSQHKKAGITGASYTVENKEPMGKGAHGKSYITLAKDKLGGVNYVSGPSSEKRFIGTLHVNSDSTMGFTIEAWIEPEAAKKTSAPAGFTPSKDYERRRAATDAAKAIGGPTTKGEMKARMGGNGAAAGTAVDYVLSHGYLRKAGMKYEFVRDYNASELATGTD
jgi:hypothetical protein